MNKSSNGTIGWVISLAIGIVCAIIAGGNKDTPVATIVFFLTVAISRYVIYRMENGSRY